MRAEQKHGRRFKTTIQSAALAAAPKKRALRENTLFRKDQTWL
jgi:hypothetical protein